jgi:hypothetical protein
LESIAAMLFTTELLVNVLKGEYTVFEIIFVGSCDTLFPLTYKLKMAEPLFPDFI